MSVDVYENPVPKKRTIELDVAWQEMLAIFAADGGKYEFALKQEDVEGCPYLVIVVKDVYDTMYIYKTKNMKDGQYLIDKITKHVL